MLSVFIRSDKQWQFRVGSQGLGDERHGGDQPVCHTEVGNFRLRRVHKIGPKARGHVVGGARGSLCSEARKRGINKAKDTGNKGAVLFTYV